MRFYFLFTIIFTVLSLPAIASNNDDHVATLDEIIEETTTIDVVKDFSEMIEPSQIRMDAIKQAALSYGARSGLAKRTSEIRKTLDARADTLDRIYDFNRLLIPAPSGFLMEPPIISEGENATLIESGGQTAAIADRIFNINRNARIVSTSRNWRAYLEREWGQIEQPPQVLFPRTDEEKKVWVEYIQKGWEQGLMQADEILQADLNTLVADFTGMVRYRRLLTMGVVSAPFAMQEDRGVTGGGDEMRVGDRAIRITGPSQLRTEAFEWQPVSR